MRGSSEREVGDWPSKVQKRAAKAAEETDSGS
jgi:hypothetical protein